MQSESSEPEIELPLRAAPTRPARLIASAVELKEAVKVLSGETGAFAVDAERASGFKYSSRAYLVQVARGQSPLYLIDTAAIAPVISTALFSDLADVLHTDTWILHAATQDLMCLREIGLTPSRLFDTELGGRLAGLPRVGLGAMCETLLGFKLAKEHSAVDWSTRPLQEDWLTYAALDIDVLPQLHDKVHALLKEQHKLDYATEEFEALLSFQPKPQKPDRWRGTSGGHEVKDQRGLAIIREVWTARESLARKLDVSPGRLVPDVSISAIAKNPPRSRSELASRRDFHGRASRTYLDTWWKALEKGLETIDLPPIKLPHDGIPNYRNWAQRFPAADARLNAAKPVVAELATELNMPIENLLTPDYLRQLCWQPPQVLTAVEISKALRALGARAWQTKLVSERLATALSALTEVSSSAEAE